MQHFLHFVSPFMSSWPVWIWTSNLAKTSIIGSPSPRTKTTPERGVAMVMRPILFFWAQLYIRNSWNFVHKYDKFQRWDDKLLLNGRGQEHVTHSENLRPNHISGIGEARHFKFGLLTAIEEYSHVCDRLPSKEMCWGSRNLFNSVPVINW